MTDKSPIRTLIVDDEPFARLRLRTLLGEHADFVVIGECADGREALDAIRRLRPDLVFLDVQMAELDGVAVAHELEHDARQGVSPAVVFVTAFDQYAVRAFDLHALDYLLKPFDEDRFVAALQRVRAQRSNSETRDAHGRLLALLRDLSRGEPVPAPSSSAPRGTVLRVGDVEVDIRARSARRGATPIPLRPKEFDLLVAMLKRAGDVVSRRELLHEVWGYSDGVVSRTVDTHIAELRRKMGHAPTDSGYIATVARSGYRLQV
jgi:DNA-binding response OmpR family regulator